MFCDLTTIGDADCLVFIPRLVKWKVYYVQFTPVTKTTCAKNSYTNYVICDVWGACL